MRLLSILFLLLSIACHAQVNVTGKSFKIANSDSTHGESNNTEYATSSGKYRYKEGGTWYYRASTATVASAISSAAYWPLTGSRALTGNVTINGGIGFSVSIGSASFPLSTFTTRSTNAEMYATSITFAPDALSVNSPKGYLFIGDDGSGGSSSTIAWTSDDVGTETSQVTAGSGGVSLSSSNDFIEMSTNGTQRITINNNGSWTVNGSTGTSGQMITSAGASSAVTWTTPISGTGSANRIPYWTGTTVLSFGPYWDNSNIRLGIGGTPFYDLDILGGGSTTARILTSGTNGISLVLERQGGTASNWSLYAPSGSTDIRFFSGSDLFTFTTTGRFKILTAPTNDNTESSFLVRQSDGEIQTKNDVVDGSGGSTRFAFWSDANTLTSDAQFTFDATTNLALLFNTAGTSSTTIGGGEIQANNSGTSARVTIQPNQILVNSDGDADATTINETGITTASGGDFTITGTSSTVRILSGAVEMDAGAGNIDIVTTGSVSVEGGTQAALLASGTASLQSTSNQVIITGQTDATINAVTGDVTVTSAANDVILNPANHVIINGGVSNNGSGFKHGRATTGSVSAGATALVTITWGTAFSTTDYTVSAAVVDSTASNASMAVVHVETISTTQVQVRVINNSAGSLTGTVHVIAVHDGGSVAP